MTIKSENVKQQSDYIVMMNHINSMIEKPESQPIPGSITLGKKYATSYMKRINSMLESEYIDMDIMKDLKREIKTDIKVVEADTAFRGYIPNAKDNVKMMCMIADFILSL
jgi:hypothetical protein